MRTEVRQTGTMAERRGRAERKPRLCLKKGRALVAMMLLLGVITYFAGLVFASDEQTVPVVYKEVTVKAGDSLWKLASRHQEQSGMGVRELVDAIKEVNGLDSSMLIPGQNLRIPVMRE